MSDATAKAERADSSAREAEKTDEQLWRELEQDEKGEKPDVDDAEDADDATDAKDADGDDASSPEPETDDAEGSSEDGEDDAKDDGGTGEAPEALQAQIERLQHALSSEKGRTAASRREIDRLRSEISSARQAQQEHRDDESLKERREKLEAANKEYADVIGPLMDHVKDLEGRLDQLSSREAKELEGAQARLTEILDEQWGTFTTEHPDGLQVIADNRDAFGAWIEDQPKALRDIYAANRQDIVDGTQAAYLVSQFKSALLGAGEGEAPEPDPLQARRQRQLAGARSHRSTGRQQASSAPPPDAADPAAHWEYWERRDRAK